MPTNVNNQVPKPITTKEIFDIPDIKKTMPDKIPPGSVFTPGPDGKPGGNIKDFLPKLPNPGKSIFPLPDPKDPDGKAPNEPPYRTLPWTPGPDGRFPEPPPAKTLPGNPDPDGKFKDLLPKMPNPDLGKALPGFKIPPKNEEPHDIIYC